MQQYIARRLLLFIPTLLGVTIVIFTLMRIVPGDPAIAILGGPGGEGTFTQEDVKELRQRLGLGRPLYVQYLDWIWGVVRLDFGTSLRLGVPVVEELQRRYPITLELTLLSVIISTSLAVPTGVLSAIRQDTIIDYIFRVISIIGLAMPTFWLGTLIVLVLSRYFEWFPPLGTAFFWDDPSVNLQQLIWPALGLGYYLNAVVARMTRSQMLEVLREDYIRTAWAKGLRERVILLRHALRNAILPVITMIGLQFSVLLGGSVVMETIFSIRGMGRMLIQSVFYRDYPVIEAIVFLIALTFLTVNLIVDLFYGWADPRIRYR